jgi:homotetrameric cytidine deaminase
MQVTPDVEKAYKIAWMARSQAYAPYSKFQVGAALKLEGVADAVPGCNVENASYGATICAERSAVCAAVGFFGKIKPEFLVIVTGEKNATVPCGVCLQVLAEFCGDDMPVYLGNGQGIIAQKKFKEFLPHAFRVFEVPK